MAFSNRVGGLVPPAVPSTAASPPTTASPSSFQQRLERPATAGGPSGSAHAHAQALELLAAQQASNMQYLALQHALSSPRFSVLSNVMRARHEAAKNSIANIR